MGICASKDVDMADTEAEYEPEPEAPADPTILMWCEQEEYDEVQTVHRARVPL